MVRAPSPSKASCCSVSSSSVSSGWVVGCRGSSPVLVRIWKQSQEAHQLGGGHSHAARAPGDPIDGSPPGSPIPGILQSRSLSGGGGKPSFPSPSAGDLRELPRVPLTLEAAQGAPRDPRRDSRGERSPWLPLETRPDSPGSQHCGWYLWGYLVCGGSGWEIWAVSCGSWGCPGAHAHNDGRRCCETPAVAGPQLEKSPCIWEDN